MEGKGVFAVFLIPIIAVILLGIIWSTVQTATVPTAVTNESFAGVTNTYVALTYDDWAACSAIRNGTHETMGIGNYTVNLAAGSVNLTSASGTYYADYTYKADSYLTSSMSRTIVGYLPLIFAIVIFVFIAGFIVLKRKSD